SVQAHNGVTELRYERPWYERLAGWTSLLAWMSVLTALLVLADGRRRA
ncbi:MAG: hypothetical protein GY847_18650, partial [Proteobacteria bacterium]|nr:hypothetical protein [Pseudomonadota bacterium]